MAALPHVNQLVRFKCGGTDTGGHCFPSGTWEEGEEDPFLSWWKNRDDLITLAYAVAMGGLVATSVFIFDVSIQYVHDLPDILAQVRRIPVSLG